MKLYILPSAHVSKKSVQKVKNSINDLDLDLVAVELCPDRAKALIRGYKPGFFDLIKSPTYAFLFLSQQAIGAIFKSKPGLEMETALKMARDKKLKVLLADMPIQRIMAGFKQIPWSEKFKMIIPSKSVKLPKMSPGNIDSLTTTDNITKLISYIEMNYPYTYEFLINKRNHYIFKSLLKFPENKILLVIGAGHLPGLMKLINQYNYKNPELKIDVVIV